MGTFKSINQYRRSIKQRYARAIRTAKRGAAKASLRLNSDLKQTAAYRTGQLAKSVRRRKIKDGYSVIGGYTKGKFNVGRYINMELNDIVGPGRRYPTLNATAKVNPWWTKNVDKMVKRYRSSYKHVRAQLRS